MKKETLLHALWELDESPSISIVLSELLALFIFSICAARIDNHLCAREIP